MRLPRPKRCLSLPHTRHNAPGIYSQNPGADVGKFFTKRVKAQFIISCDQYRGVRGRFAGAVKSGDNFIIVSGKTGPGTNGAKVVAKGEGGGYPGYRGHDGFYKTLNKGVDLVSGAFVPTGPWRRLWSSTDSFNSFYRYLEEC